MSTCVKKELACIDERINYDLKQPDYRFLEEGWGYSLRTDLQSRSFPLIGFRNKRQGLPTILQTNLKLMEDQIKNNNNKILTLLQR